jgi:uncharacterized protein (TIGR02246 family)
VRKVILATAVMSLFAVSTAAAESPAQTCTPITKAEVSGLFERWNAALQTGNPDEVVKNYAENAVLLPTMSNKTRTTPAEIKDYFVHFLQKKPKGRIDNSAIHIGCNDAFDAGTYTFTLTDTDGKTSDVAARYSFVYEFKDGKWLIAHHHSSAMPEKVGEATHTH